MKSKQTTLVKKLRTIKSSGMIHRRFIIEDRIIWYSIPDPNSNYSPVVSNRVREPSSLDDAISEVVYRQLYH
jgi:hypothetical protein